MTVRATRSPSHPLKRVQSAQTVLRWSGDRALRSHRSRRAPAPGEPAATPPAPTGTRSVTTRATLAGVIVSALLILAIVLGSRMLRNFDSALLPYAVATVFLAFGVAYRYTVWISAPGARRLFKQGWRSLFSMENFRRAPTALPRMIATYLGFQKFLGALFPCPLGRPPAHLLGLRPRRPDHLPAHLGLVHLHLQHRFRSRLRDADLGIQDPRLRLPEPARLADVPRPGHRRRPRHPRRLVLPVAPDEATAAPSPASASPTTWCR